MQNNGCYNTLEIGIRSKGKDRLYCISPFGNKQSLWLENEEGEGMEIGVIEAFKMVDKYWKDNF